MSSTRHICGHRLGGGAICHARVLCEGDRCGHHLPSVLAVKREQAARARTDRLRWLEREVRERELELDRLAAELARLRSELWTLRGGRLAPDEASSAEAV